jgi:dTDP-4-amino-4,6-dideoxygalactose transaminase
MPTIGVPQSALHRAFDEIQSSGHFTEGKYTRLFEDAITHWCDMPAVSVSNCGAGLFAVLRQVPKRSGVAVVSANTFFATAAMAKEAGFQVVGADCSKDDFCLTAELLDRYAPGNVDVVILTHVGGGVAEDYERIAQWCKDHKVFLLEDAAHALGVGSDSMVNPCAGWLGDAAVFSLYGTKAVPIGEGGVVVSNVPALVERVRTFCNYGKRRVGGAVSYTGTGFNFRISEWQAAIGYLQMKRLPEIMERRAQAAYALSQVIEPMVKCDDSNWYKFIVSADFPAMRLTGQVYAASDQLTASFGLDGAFPNAAWVAAHHKCLPIEEGLYDGMTAVEIEEFLGV